MGRGKSETQGGEVMKRDYLYLAIVMVIMLLTSCMVQDSRAMVPEEDIIEELSDAITSKVNYAKYMASIEKAENEPEEVEEIIEESIIEEEDEIAEIEEETPEEYFEEWTEQDETRQDETWYEGEYVEEYVEEQTGLTYLGTYKITAYEWTGNPCANGNYPTEGYTVACNSLSLGTQVYIEGIGYRTVEDRGGGGSDWIDLYLGDVSACYQFGVQYLDVYLVG